MADLRTDIRMQNQVIELFERKYSCRAIARALKIDRRTIKKILNRHQLKSDVTPIAEITSAEKPVASQKPATWRDSVDWEKIIYEVRVRGTTLRQLYIESEIKASETSFWRELNKRTGRIKAEASIRIRQHHKPGEKTFIDFCDGIDILDLKTKNKSTTQFFCGVLPFSSYTYGEFTLNQKLATFIEAQERMWHYFGGVTKYVVPDNLKAGVTKADWYDPVSNPTYVEYANHAGFAVVPARPVKPRDKAGVECEIGVVQRGFYQEVRDRIFYSLTELNQIFREYLNRLNGSVMKDHGVSRCERFSHEKTLLLPLPEQNFEFSDWKTAKVHPDCHVQVEKNFYSLPHVYVGRNIRVKLGSRLLEIFDEELNQIAIHARLFGIGKYSTIEAHYPEKAQIVARFDVEYAKAQGRKIGPNTSALIEELLGGTHPLRYLRRVLGILRFTKSVSKEAMEFAAKQAILFRKTDLYYIRACAGNFHGSGGRLVTLQAPIRDLSAVHLHDSLK